MSQASAATEPTDTAEGLLREWSVLVRTIERAPGKTVRVGEVTLAHLHKSTALGDAWAELDGECGSGNKRVVVLVRLNEGVVQVINRNRPHVQEIKSAANPKDLLKRIVTAITDTHTGAHGSSVAQAAAEPAQDPREVLCNRLKSRYNLDLYPYLITYLGRDGIDYNGNVYWVKKNLIRLPPVRFRNFQGNFICSGNNLISLENAPVRVSEDFYCARNRLTSLKHAPEYVGGDFSCSDNNLTSLAHAPGYVGGRFYCSGNHLPADTKKPKGVRGDFVLTEHSPEQAQAAVEPSINPDNVRTDMYFYLAENAQHVKFRYGALHGAGHELYYDTCFARSSTVLVLRYQHITAEHIHGDLDVNVSTHGHVFVISSNHDRVQVRIQGDMESLAGAVVRAGAQLLLHKLKTGWSSETAEAAAEPAQDPREVFCQRLKAKYDLSLDPEKITYMGRGGIDYDGSVIWTNKNLTRIPVRFRSVTGNFICFRNHLTTLAGAPAEVGGGFYCYNNHLTTLAGAPGHVGGYFICSDNHLTTLAGAPGHVGGDFYCYNNHLTTLEHAPGHVGGNFVCSHNHLPPDTKKPVGVKGKFVLGQQTPAPVHGAAEPASDARTHISPGEMKGLVKNLTFNKSFQLAGYTVTLTPDHADDAFHVIFTRDRKKMCFLVLRYFPGHVRVSNISAADAHIRCRVELAHVPLEVTAFLRMVLRACLDLAAVAFDKYAREHG